MTTQRIEASVWALALGAFRERFLAHLFRKFPRAVISWFWYSPGILRFEQPSPQEQDADQWMKEPAAWLVENAPHLKDDGNLHT